MVGRQRHPEGHPTSASRTRPRWSPSLWRHLAPFAPRSPDVSCRCARRSTRFPLPTRCGVRRRPAAEQERTAEREMPVSEPSQCQQTPNHRPLQLAGDRFHVEARPVGVASDPGLLQHRRVVRYSKHPRVVHGGGQRNWMSLASRYSCSSPPRAEKQVQFDTPDNDRTVTSLSVRHRGELRTHHPDHPAGEFGGSGLEGCPGHRFALGEIATHLIAADQPFSGAWVLRASRVNT